MPRSTFKYPYEWKILEGCQKLAEQLLGDCDTGSGFTILIDTTGRVIRFQAHDLEKETSKDEEGHHGTVFFDPFDGPVNTYVKWKNVTREMVQRALKIQLEEEDFLEIGGTEKSGFPSEHDVMF